MYRLILFSILTFSFLVSCNGSHCIEIGGTWKNVNGNIKYCWDSEASAARPILTDSNGENAVLITQEDVNQIANELEKPTASMSIKTLTLPQQIEKILRKINKP